MLDDVDIGCPIDWSHPLNLGRVAWWLALPHSGFRGNTWRDLVGLSGRKANHGTLTNGPTWSGAKGRPGGAASLSFDGTNDYVDVTSTTLDVSGDKTIAMWVRPTSFAGYNLLFARNQSSPNVGYSAQLNITTGLLGYVKQGAVEVDAATTAATLNVWNHVAFVKTAAGVSFYRDGRGETVANVTAESGGSSPPVRIGSDARGSTFAAFHMDDVTFYNRALSAAELGELYRLSRLGYPDVLNRF